MKIGIIGIGFVGGAIKNAYETFGHETVCIDPDKGYNATYEDIIETDAIFVCVPSPMKDDGDCDTSYLRDVVTKLKEYKRVIISKTTAPSDVYCELLEQVNNLVFVPEFLRDVNADQDYLNEDFSIIGGKAGWTGRAEQVIRLGQPLIKKVMRIEMAEACVVKYLENSLLATKVVFMNEVHALTKKLGLDYSVIKEAIQLDVRQGNSHFDVPGPDGDYGFGGKCFPKDTSAMLRFAERNDVELSVLKQAVEKNKKIRTLP